MEKEFFLSPKEKKLRLFGVFALIILFVIYLFGVSPKWSFIMILFCSAIAIGIVAQIVEIYTEKLTMTPDGITYKKMGMSAYVKWNDVQQIAIYRSMAVRPTECVLAPKEKSLIHGWGSFGVYGRIVYLPVENFADSWRDSELGSQIKQYAPHLFNSKLAYFSLFYPPK